MPPEAMAMDGHGVRTPLHRKTRVLNEAKVPRNRRAPHLPTLRIGSAARESRTGDDLDACIALLPLRIACSTPYPSSDR